MTLIFHTYGDAKTLLLVRVNGTGQVKIKLRAVHINDECTVHENSSIAASPSQYSQARSTSSSTLLPIDHL